MQEATRAMQEAESNRNVNEDLVVDPNTSGTISPSEIASGILGVTVTGSDILPSTVDLPVRHLKHGCSSPMTSA